MSILPTRAYMYHIQFCYLWNWSYSQEPGPLNEQAASVLQPSCGFFDHSLPYSLRQGLTLTWSSSIGQTGWPASPEQFYYLPFQYQNASASPVLGLKACVTTVFCLCHFIFLKSFLITMVNDQKLEDPLFRRKLRS